MGEDGLAPRALSAVHPRFHTPALAILVMAIWACVLVVGGAALTRGALPPLNVGFGTLDLNMTGTKPLFDVLTDYAMFGAVIFETMAVLSIFVFRWTRPDAERPYRCWGYPVVPALYILLPALIVGNMFLRERTEALIGCGFIALGVCVYYAFGLPYTTKGMPEE
jgi:amino acid transporter